MGGGVGNNDQWFSKKISFKIPQLFFEIYFSTERCAISKKKKKKSMKLMRVECEQDKWGERGGEGKGERERKDERVGEATRAFETYT